MRTANRASRQARFPRVAAAFSRCVRLASAKLPPLAGTRAAACPMADREHAASWRQFMHTFHRPGVVCFARAAETELFEPELLGMLMHEFGHLAAARLRRPAHASRRWSHVPLDEVQMEADTTAATLFGLRSLTYNERELEQVDPKEFERRERSL